MPGRGQRHRYADDYGLGGATEIAFPTMSCLEIRGRMLSGRTERIGSRARTGAARSASGTSRPRSVSRWQGHGN
jgi:hypothetical protein